MHHGPHAPLRPTGRVDRVALVSVHTCPLDQPGIGDAGGMNVYIREVARRLGEMGVRVDVFTRDAGCPTPIASLGENVRVVHLEAGPRRPLPKEKVGETVCAFSMAMIAFGEEERSQLEPGAQPYDLIHSNYWMGGRVGRMVAQRWGIPFLQTFHTLGKVKNLTLTEGDTPEARERLVTEEKIVDLADMILAPTLTEAEELAGLYSANPSRIRVVSPGVDPDLFCPGPSVRDRFGWPNDRPVVLFVGRLQPLKQPEVALRAVGQLAQERRGPERPFLAVMGGPSGIHGSAVEDLQLVAREAGLDPDDVMWMPPLPHADLADAYRSATVTIMPSRTESFGLVALESQGCGTPVVGSDVGGLRTAIRHEETGLLAPVGDVDAFATALERVIFEPGLRDALSARAIGFARRFDWRWVARGLLGAYESAASIGARAGLDLAAES